MKKILFAVLALAVILSLAACGETAVTPKATETGTAETPVSTEPAAPQRPHAEGGKAHEAYELAFELPEGMNENTAGGEASQYYYTGADLTNAGTVVHVYTYTAKEDFELETYAKQQSTASIVRAQMSQTTINDATWYTGEWAPSNGSYHNAYYYALCGEHVFEIVVEKGDDAFDSILAMLNATLFFVAE